MIRSDRIRIEYSDEDLRSRVVSFLKSRHFPAFEKLGIDVHNGEVTLSGDLSSYYEKQVAITSCQRVAGVLSLHDRIDVGIGKTRVAAG